MPWDFWRDGPCIRPLSVDSYNGGLTDALKKSLSAKKRALVGRRALQTVSQALQTVSHSAFIEKQWGVGCEQFTWVAKIIMFLNFPIGGVWKKWPTVSFLDIELCSRFLQLRMQIYFLIQPPQEWIYIHAPFQCIYGQLTFNNNNNFNELVMSEDQLSDLSHKSTRYHIMIIGIIGL